MAFGIYYVAAMLVLLRYMKAGRSGLTLETWPLEGRLFKDILKVGLPTAVSTTLTNLTVVLVTGAVGLFGTQSLAAYGIASRLDYIMIPILFGLSTAVLTMVGVNMGAGQVARARKIAWTSSFVGAGLAGTIGVTVAIFPMLWLHLFSHDPQVVGFAAVYLRIVAPSYAALGFGFVIAFAAQGAGPRAVAVRRSGVAAGVGCRRRLACGQLFWRRDDHHRRHGVRIAGVLRADLPDRDGLEIGLAHQEGVAPGSPRPDGSTAPADRSDHLVDLRFFTVDRGVGAEQRPLHAPADTG